MTLSATRSGFQESTDVMSAVGVEAGAQRGGQETGGQAETNQEGRLDQAKARS